MSDDDTRASLVLYERHLDLLDDLQEDDDRDVRSRSEAARELIDEWDELRKECEDLRTENERLQNRIMTLIDEREERQELVRFVDEEEQRRKAGIVQRAKWWAFGKDD
jgi:chromosome segregation ATPase